MIFSTQRLATWIRAAVDLHEASYAKPQEKEYGKYTRTCQDCANEACPGTCG
jgi:hypothetical protein